jgi:hypothetical protein
LHTYLIGASGSGKSTYMLSEGDGPFAFLDKHGQAARQLADSRECIYWRPADLSHPIGLTRLKNPPDERWTVTADFVSVVQ